MNIRLAWLFSFAFLWCTDVKSDIPYNQYWTKANLFYKQKQYDSSVYYYEKIAETKPASAELYYNLGNAYYRLNNIGQSVLNYKRALKIKPGYIFAQDNLLLAQSRMKTKVTPSNDIFFITWWKNFTRPAFSQVWAITALVLFLALAGISFWVRWRKVYDYKYRGVLFMGALLFLFILLAAFVSSDKRYSQNEAVITSPDAVFKPDMKNPKSEMLPEGTVVECDEQKGDWLSVKLDDGREGWVQIAAVEKI